MAREKVPLVGIRAHICVLSPPQRALIRYAPEQNRPPIAKALNKCRVTGNWVSLSDNERSES